MLDRIYKLLGFRECRAPIPPDRPGCAYGSGAGSSATITFGLLDRLRILISGKVMCDMVHQMDRMPKFFVSTSAWSVLPPNYPLPKEIAPPLMAPISKGQFEAEMRRPPDRHVSFTKRHDWMG